MDAVRDVVICGGGLAGLLLARQVRRELPDLSVTVLEKTTRPLPDACHKVGESSVETGSQYLERLGLADHLLERHIVKLGLRFFPGHGELPLHERTEIGPSAEPIVRSYQLDRGRFEGDVRAMLEEDGVVLREGARVRTIDLGAAGAPHVVTFDADRATESVGARWVVDATGRSALLRGALKLKRGTRHPASAGWFRIAGRFDISDMVPPSEAAWHRRACAGERWRSTNHFMGDGYWAWVIPLSTGHTSIGLVVHEDRHDFHEVSSLDAVMAFLGRHEPHLARALADAEVKDFLCLRHYNNMVARTWSEDRWAIVGEAGAFVDPLYSPGTDFIAFANSFTTELLRIDREGGDLAPKVAAYNAQYRAFVAATTELFRTAGPVYGHAQAMSAKIYWDNFTYWSYTCQYFQQSVWTWARSEHEPFDECGRRFVECTTWVNALLRAWAEAIPSRAAPIMMGLPQFPSLLVDAHIATGQPMSKEEALAYVRMRAEQAREMVAELVLRVVQELGPERSAALLERVHYPSWGVSVAPERLDAERLDSIRRRHALSTVARDVDRNLGPIRRHPDAARARELLAQGSPA